VIHGIYGLRLGKLQGRLIPELKRYAWHGFFWLSKESCLRRKLAATHWNWVAGRIWR
jgi:hypothetical protein